MLRNIFFKLCYDFSKKNIFSRKNLLRHMIERMNLARIADFRRRTGMTQAQLANELGTTRIQICMAEKMERPLSTSAELKFIDLLKLYPLPEDIPAHEKKQRMTTAEEECKNNFTQFCQWRLAKVKHSRNLLKAKLTAKHVQYEKQYENIRLIETSMATNPADTVLGIRRDAMKKKLKNCDHLAQLQLQYDIELLEMEEELLRWKLEELLAKEASDASDGYKEPAANQE